jgi:Gnt-I system high-affinity gluconate transporter
MSLLIILFCIILLVVLVTWAKLNAFLSFLLVSITGGLLLGIPLGKVIDSVQNGFGNTVGQLGIIICFGAVLGKLIAVSGAAQKIADTLVSSIGKKNIQWALALTGFVVGIPLFYGIGFVLLVPLAFTIVYKYKLPAVYIGLPMLAALSVTHGFLPPHPSPTALVGLLHANMGLTLTYGVALAIPAIIIAGPLFSRTLKKLPSNPLSTFVADDVPADKQPGAFNSFFTALLPVLLLIIATLVPYISKPHSLLQQLVVFKGFPPVAMIIAVLFATISLGVNQGKSMKEIAEVYADAIKDIALILLIIGASGSFSQVLTDSGVSGRLAQLLQSFSLPPLILGWLIAAIIRISLGSATIAGLTAAGIVAPLMIHTHADPNLMVLAIGAGSLAFSHVNDSGFWMFKEYFNLSIKDTIRSWSVMESIVSVVGLIGVLLLNVIVKH